MSRRFCEKCWNLADECTCADERKKYRKFIEAEAAAFREEAGNQLMRDLLDNAESNNNIVRQDTLRSVGNPLIVYFEKLCEIEDWKREQF